MARTCRRWGGDRVLESQHLVGLFPGVVLLCGVFFTLGYVMGRNQFGGSVHAAETPSRNAPSSSANSKEGESPVWDFYPGKKENDHLEPAATAKSPASSSAPTKPNAV